MTPMTPMAPFVDIHCHLIPGIDDGAQDWDQALRMARMAVDSGTGLIIATPHQLGSFQHNQGDAIRARTVELQAVLEREGITLKVLPGGDVRIEDGMLAGLRAGTVLTLADRRRHVLLELPHELYFPLEPILRDLESAGMQGILSHPERNLGLLARPHLWPRLVDAGCLMQVTAGSLTGAFGPACQQLAQSMLADGWVHFLASDGHSPLSRRPRLRRGYEATARLVSAAAADLLCCDNPGRVARGESVEAGRVVLRGKRRGWFRPSRAA